MSSSISQPQPPSTPKSSAARTRPAITTPSSAANSHSHSHRRTNSLGYTSPTEIVPRSSAARRMSMTTTSQSASLPVVKPKSVFRTLVDREQVLLSVLVGSLVLTGIMYSLIHETSLDTSHIHHIHHTPRTAYFAKKSNLFNVIFVKQAWGWTTLLYLVHLVTSPPTSSLNAGVSSRTRRLGVWLLATLAWLGFTRWFFGAGLGDRIIALTGGNCAFPLPEGIDLTTARKAFPKMFTTGSGSDVGSGGKEKLFVPLPHEFCAGSRLTQSSFPELFNLLPVSSLPATSNTGTDLQATSSHESLFALPRPRWHRGFDISGHTFLLVLCIMILGRELSGTWRRWAAYGTLYSQAATDGEKSSGRKPPREREFERLDIPANTTNGSWLKTVNQWSGIAATALVGIWLWMILMTAVYFHNPPEKLSGLALGLATAWLINILIPSSTSVSPFDPVSVPVSTPSQTPIDTFRPRTHSRTNSASLGASLPASGIGQVLDLDENAARRGAVVDDGVIYEDEESPDEEVKEGGREKVE